MRRRTLIVLFSIFALFAGNDSYGRSPAAAVGAACKGRCWDNFQYCLSLRGSQTACFGAYNDCTFTCFINDTTGRPADPIGSSPVDFGSVAVGEGPAWIPKFYNDTGHHSTLYASWTPPVAGDIGRFSDPRSGPFALVFGQRWELKPSRGRKPEGQKVAVQFVPTEVGPANATLYMWWDVRGSFRWHSIWKFKGTGAPRPPPASPPTGGRRGGTESMPMWMFQSVVGMPGMTWHRPPALWRVESTGARQRAVGRGTRVLIPLRDVMPDSISGLVPRFDEPESVIGGSNAIEALSADYVDPQTNELRAVILAFRTRNDVYAHTYGVCSRVKGSWLEAVQFPPVAVPGSATPATFWQSTSAARDGTSTTSRREIASGFAVYPSRDARRFVVDSHWLFEQYPLHAERDGDVLTLQVWSSDAALTATAREAVLAKFAQRGTVEYRNTAPVETPSLLMNSAAYENDGAYIATTNSSGAEKTVNFTAITWSAANAQSEERFSFTRTIGAGEDAIDLPMPGRLNGVIYMNEPGSSWTDMVYVADGSWFSFGESGPPAWTAPTCPAAFLGAADLALAGCSRLESEVPAGGFRGIGRSVVTYTRPTLDAQQYGALSFHAQGSELTSEVQVVSQGENGDRLVHTALFTPSSGGRQITIPFSWLRGVDGARGVPFSGERLLEITWRILSEPQQRTTLTIGNVYLTSDFIFDSAPLSLGADGAWTAIGRAGTALEGLTATLAYRRRGEGSWVRIPMVLIGDLWQTSIPGQPSGTILESFIEFTDSSERTATIPPDAPYETEVFVVAEQPVILIDDFEDPIARNLVGGADWLFRSIGGMLDTVRSGGALRLVFDVRAPGSFAGWVSPWRKPIDTTIHDSLLIRIRGGAGDERLRIGLGDSAGREHKLILAKFVDGGISSDWTEVRVPLEMFTDLDRTSVDRVVLVFENELGSGAGNIEVGEIRLASTATVNYLPIENFDDGSSETAFGGHLWTTSGGTGTITGTHSTEARLGSKGLGYRVAAAGDSTSWAVVGFELRDLDARSLQRLRFAIRGGRGGEQPNVYLASKTDGVETRRYVNIASYIQVGTSYQLVTIPLSDFAQQGIDLEHLTALQIVWEWAPFSDQIDLDEIRFER